MYKQPVSMQQIISYNILIFKYLSIFKSLFFGENIKKSAIHSDMYPKSWTHIYKLGGHHGCFSVFYWRHPFCFYLNPFVIIIINIFIYSNCKFFKGCIVFFESIIHFCFYSSKECFHDAVIVTIPFSRHRLNYSMFL